MKTNCSLFASPLAQTLLRVKVWRAGGVRRVGKGLHYGGVPTERQLRGLAARGVKQVIDLRQRHETDGNEAQMCGKLGLTYVSVPMGEALPDFSAVEGLLARLSSAPTYLHCQHGCDRSGAVVALHRMVSEGWSLQRAGVELLRHGFDAQLDTLARDICHYTHELQRTRRVQAASSLRAIA